VWPKLGLRDISLVRVRKPRPRRDNSESESESESESLIVLRKLSEVAWYSIFAKFFGLSELGCMWTSVRRRRKCGRSPQEDKFGFPVHLSYCIDLPTGL